MLRAHPATQGPPPLTCSCAMIALLPDSCMSVSTAAYIARRCCLTKGSTPHTLPLKQPQCVPQPHPWPYHLTNTSPPHLLLGEQSSLPAPGHDAGFHLCLPSSPITPLAPPPPLGSPPPPSSPADVVQWSPCPRAGTRS
jgi:hypothetical protein